jgi:hypothetical protein
VYEDRERPMTEPAAAVALEVAARFYLDDDLMWIDAGTQSYAAHKDGKRY